MGIYLVCFAIGMGATPYAVNSEIYPLPLRATANSLAITTHWICNYIVAAAFLSAIESDIGSVSAPSRLDLNLRRAGAVLSGRDALHIQASS